MARRAPSCPRIITAYEDPGEGGHYDNFSTANHAPSAVSAAPTTGQPYSRDLDGATVR